MGRRTWLHVRRSMPQAQTAALSLSGCGEARAALSRFGKPGPACPPCLMREECPIARLEVAMGACNACMENAKRAGAARQPNGLLASPRLSAAIQLASHTPSTCAGPAQVSDGRRERCVLPPPCSALLQ